MEILIIGVILVVDLVFQWYLIKGMKEKPEKEEPRIEEKPKVAELSQEQKEKQEKIRKAFENLMGYGYEDALRKKE